MPLGYERGQRSSTLQPLFLEKPKNQLNSIGLAELHRYVLLLPEDAALDLPREAPW